jgi:hypothetical protein
MDRMMSGSSSPVVLLYIPGCYANFAMLRLRLRLRLLVVSISKLSLRRSVTHPSRTKSQRNQESQVKSRTLNAPNQGMLMLLVFRAGWRVDAPWSRGRLRDYHLRLGTQRSTSAYPPGQSLSSPHLRHTESKAYKKKIYP